MFQSFCSPLLAQPEAIDDIFVKYSQGKVHPKMPFKLYLEDSVIEASAKRLKKRNSRGPYRKYNPEEKSEIIHRILKGEALKAIAEETRIPKRNLIRWKHEYLVQERVILPGSLSSDEDFSTSSKLLKEGSTVETKEAISESKIRVENCQ